MFLEQSAWSRHRKIIEVDNITQKEVLFYLRSKRVEVKAVDKAYDLAGGCIVHLMLIADVLNTKENFDDTMIHYYF